MSTQIHYYKQGKAYMNKNGASPNQSAYGCWDCLIAVLQDERPTGLARTLQLTSVAEEYFRNRPDGLKTLPNTQKDSI